MYLVYSSSTPDQTISRPVMTHHLFFMCDLNTSLTFSLRLFCLFFYCKIIVHLRKCVHGHCSPARDGPQVLRTWRRPIPRDARTGKEKVTAYLLGVRTKTQSRHCYIYNTTKPRGRMIFLLVLRKAENRREKLSQNKKTRKKIKKGKRTLFPFL